MSPWIEGMLNRKTHVVVEHKIKRQFHPSPFSFSPIWGAENFGSNFITGIVYCILRRGQVWFRKAILIIQSVKQYFLNCLKDVC